MIGIWLFLSISILIEANKYIWWILWYLTAFLVINGSLWNYSMYVERCKKHEMQVFLTLQNEYVFAFHTGGLWSLLGGRGAQQLAESEGLKIGRCRGKVFQSLLRVNGRLLICLFLQLTSLSAFISFKTALILCCCTSSIGIKRH